MNILPSSSSSLGGLMFSKTSSSLLPVSTSNDDVGENRRNSSHIHPAPSRCRAAWKNFCYD